MISIKNEREIALIRKSCDIIIDAFALVAQLIAPGTSTEEIDREVEQYIRSREGLPAFKGFNGYPASTCISIDHQVVHGIPGSRRLVEGEIVSVDIGVEKEGFFGDAARTFAVGEVSAEKLRLMEVTKRALYAGIEKAVEDNRVSDISHAVQTTVEAAGFSVVRDLVGHGVGRELHEPPQIPNYGSPHMGPRLQSGMVLAIEPMVNIGTWQVVVAEDNWTVSTKDKKPSAHFEHTIVVQKEQPLILSEG